MTLTPSQRLLRLKPSLFSTTVVRGLTNPDGGLSSFTAEDGQFVSTTALGETGSYRYDPIGTGIKSTQQLNTDWSQFENHVFFNSAQVKVNAAFNKIIDRFPFDGTRKENELFYDGLTGFEKYVLDQFPKNKGYLFFSGSNAGDTATRGTWVTVKDVAGSQFPFLTREPTGANRLNPTSGSVTFQFQIYTPAQANSNQIVLQKLQDVGSNNQHGFGCFLSSSTSTSTAQLSFFVCSGSAASMSASITLNKGMWTPVTFTWDRTSGVNQIKGYVSGSLVASSSQVVIGNLNFATASLYIGTGSNVTAPVFVPVTTFSGALDELRYYKRTLTTGEMVLNQSSSIYSEPDLGLYFKFNEPSGSASSLVVDSSGQGMHGTLNSYALNTLLVRNVATGSLFGSSPMANEDVRLCPVLFPDQPEVQALKTTLLSDAESYDNDNPNTIIKLVPKQFFLYGQLLNSFPTEEGSLNTLEYGTEPNTVSMGSTQTILSLLYMWACFFDEIKLYLDAFSTLRHVDYDSTDTVPDAFLTQLAEHYGFELPPLFIGSTIDQFVNGNNVTPSIVNSEYTMQYLQNQIWRRILINANDILKSKGTVYSIKALLRAVGIDGDNIFRFKEYGGPVQQSLTALRETRNEVGAALSFRTGGYFQSSFLSSSRVEPGLPYPVGTFVYSGGRAIGTTSTNDALLTSGSWTYEGIYSWPGTESTSSTQSLVRFMTTSSANTENVLANLYATSGSGLTLYVQPNFAVGATALTMSITAPHIMDGQAWNVSFGRTRGDLQGNVSSSYFLRVGRNNLGSVVEEYTTGSYYDDNWNGNYNMNLFQMNSASYSASGSFIAVGSGSTNKIPVNDAFVNSHGLQTFDGRLAQARFWSKALSVDEWREHVRDYKSLGVYDPRVNFNFDNYRSGSYEKLRTDWSMDQPSITTNGSGQITLFDFSQHTLHASGSGFPITSSVVVPQRFYYSYISPNYDEAVTSDKVRVRSYQNLDNVLNDDSAYSVEAPVYEITQEQIPQDNGKFSIDFSVVDALNQDMMTMFSSLDVLNDILGAPSMMFGGDYPDLENLRNIYFNRLTSKLNLKGYFDFYNWFNSNIGKFIEQLIPRKTRYNGINYSIQQHMLERSKVEYHFEDAYVEENGRSRGKEMLLLQMFTGLLRKY